MDENDLLGVADLSEKAAQKRLKRVLKDFAEPKDARSACLRSVDKEGRVEFALAARGEPDAGVTSGSVWDRATRAVEALKRGRYQYACSRASR